MPNFSLKQQKVDKPVLHLEDEFQVTKTRDNTIALTTKPREVKSTNPEARFKVKRDKDRRLIVDYDLKDASGTTSLTNKGNLSLNAATASDSWSSDSDLGRNVYSLRKTGPKYITIGSSSDANMKRLRKFMSRRFTLMMWVKFESSEQNELLFSFKAANSAGQHISFTKNTSDVLNFSNYSQALNATLNSPTQWNHLAFTYNFRNNKRKIFINGKKVKASRAGTRLNLNSATEAFIGNANGLAFDNANADIYGFQIYKVALPNREIKRIYESTSIRETKQFTLTDSDLKLYYKFNDASSTIRNYGNYTDTGDNVRHRSFDGADDYISLPLSVKDTLHNTSFSISFWWRPQSLSSSLRGIFEARNTNSSFTNQWLHIQYRNNMLAFGFFNNNLFTSSFNPSSNTWYHVSVVFDTSVGRKIYINGSLNNSDSNTTTLTLNNSGGTGYVNIGKFGYPSNTFGYMDLSDFRIYTKALSSTEVSTINSAGKNNFLNTYSGTTISNLVYQYKLDSIDDVNDSGSNSSHGTNYGTLSDIDFINSRIDGNATVQSGVTNITAPFGGSCKRFDGTDDYVTAPAVLKKIFHNTSFTIACWVRFAAISAGGAFFDVADTITNTTGNTAYTRMALGVRTNKVRFTLFDIDNTPSKILDTTDFFPSTDTWYHLTFILDTSSGRKIYINGELNNSNSVTTTLSMNTAGRGEINFGVYRYLNPDGYDQFDLSEFRVYGSAFSDEAVEALYKSYFKKTKLSQIQGVGPAEKRLFISKLGHVDQDGHFITKPILTASDDLIFHLDFSNPDISRVFTNSYVFDKSGNYNTGLLANFAYPGNLHDPDFGNCIKFDGVNDFIELDNIDIKAKLNQSEFTVTFWVNFNITAEVNYPVLFLSNAGSSSNYQGLIIGGKNTEISNSSNRQGNYTFMNFEFIGSTLQSTSCLLRNNWYHCAFTYSPEGTNRRRLYINGSLDNSSTAGQDLNLSSFTGGHFEIGRNLFENPDTYFKGKLGDLRIYNRELNGDEIGKIYLETSENINYSPSKLALLNDSPVHSTGLMLQYRAENTGDSSATDRSGKNSHASANANLFDTTTLITANKSFKFDSTDKDYLLLDGFKTGNNFTGVSGSTPRSITFWTKVTDTTTERPVICYGKDSNEFKISIDSDEKVRVYNDSDKYIIFSPALTTGQKQHIAVVIDTINSVNTLIDSCKLFINGSKGYISGTSGSVNTEIDTGNFNNLEIGRDGDFYTSFDGSDDFINLPLSLKYDLHDRSFSVSFWFRPQSVSSSWEAIFASYNNNVGGRNQHLIIEYRNSAIYFSFSGSGTVLGTSGFSPVNNTWYYITCVYVYNTGKRIYINGSLNVSASQTEALVMNSTAGTGAVSIGRITTASRFAHMDLSDLRIYANALSDDEVYRLYKLGNNTCGNDLTSDLIHHWKLNETFKYKSDNTVRHRSFDGTDDYISLPLSVKDIFHNASFSIAFWVRPKETGVSNAVFAARNTSSSTANQVLHCFLESDRSFRFGFYNNDLVTTGFSYSTDVWYHIVCVYVHNTGKRIYINGSLNNSNSQTTALTLNSTAGTGYVTLGRFIHTNLRYPYIDLSDFRIYNKALSANEISAIYSGGNYSFTNTYNSSAISNLVYHYKLDSASNLNDSGSNSSHGTNQGTTSVLDTDIRHRSFDGTNDYISLPLSVKDSLHNTSFSIAFWVRPKETGELSAVFGVRNTSSSTTNQLLHLRLESNNSFKFGFYSNDLVTTGFSYSTDVWYHIVCVYVYNTGKRIYINGSLNNSNSQTTALTMNSTAGTGYVTLGRYHATDTRYPYMDLSDFRIYNKALSETEVSTIFSAGKYNFSNTYNGSTISNLVYQYKLDKDLNDSGSNSSDGTNQGTTSSIDTDIYFKNEVNNYFHGTTSTLSENTSTYFDGHLDDIRVYNKAITEDQVKNIYNGGSGSYTNETSENLKLLINAKEQSYKYEHRSFDGTNDYIELPLSVKDSLHNTAFSISFWVRPKESYPSSNAVFGVRNTSSSTTNQLLHLILESDRSFKFGFYGNNLVTTGFSYSTDIWYHIVCVYVHNTGKRIYINGSLNNSNSQTTALTMNSTAETGYVTLGRYHATDTLYPFMDLSDFRIYTKALSADEVSSIYSAGKYNFSNTYDGSEISNLAYQYKLNASSGLNDSGSTGSHGTNYGTSLGISEYLVNDKSGTGISNNVTLSSSKIVVNDKLKFNGVNTYATTSTNLGSLLKSTVVLKNTVTTVDESVIVGSKATGSSLADGDFQVKVKPSGYSNHTRNLITQYTFFERAGTIVNDRAAKTKSWQTENRLNLYNSPSWNATGGPFGEPCIVFDGTNDYAVDNTNGSSRPQWRDEVRLHNSPTAFSVSVWFNASTNISNSEFQYVVDIGILILIWNHTNSAYRASFTGRQSSGYTIAKLYTGGTPNLATNTWYHATATWEWSSGSNGVLKAYLNGELISTNSGQAALTSTLKVLNLGLHGSNYFNGKVSNLQFFNSTLTAAEVKEIYDTAHMAYENYSRNRMCMISHFEDRLLGHWKCDEGTGTVLHDSSKYKRHGTINSAAWSTHEQNPSLPVLSFDGTDDFVDCIPNFEDEIFDDFTVCFWMKPSGGSPCVVFGAGNGNNGFSIYGLESNSGNYYIRVPIYDGIGFGNSQLSAYSQKNSIKYNEWFHVAVTFRKHNVNIYLNGISNNDMGTGYSDVSIQGQDTWGGKGALMRHLYSSMSKGFFIGAESYGDVMRRYFNGKLSDIRAYTTLLSGEEIRQIYRGDYYKYSVEFNINSKVYNLECDKLLSPSMYRNLTFTYVSSNEAKLYLDDEIVSRITLPTSQTLSAGNGITLGAQDLNSSRSLWFEGTITEFRVYNTDLRSTEIRELENENKNCLLRLSGYQSKTSGLANASLINLGEDPECKINMNGFDTTAAAIDTSMPDGIIGKNIVFNGSDEYLTIDTRNKLANETQKNFTITGWINPSSSDSGTTNPVISKYGSSNESKYYKINYDDTNSELEFTIRSSTNFAYFNGSSYLNVYKWDNVKEPWSLSCWVYTSRLNRGTLFTTTASSSSGFNFYFMEGGHYRFGVYSRQHGQWALSSNRNFSTNRWYHVAFTSVYGRQNIYIDGKLTKSSSYPSFRNWTHTTSQYSWFGIGREIYGNRDYYQGGMSDLRIYSQELNIEDISRIYKSGLGGFSDNVNTNLELQLKFDNPSNIIEDSSGNSRLVSNSNVTSSIVATDHTITTKINTDSWSHFAMVCDTENLVMTVYINGVKQSQLRIANNNNITPQDINIGGDGTNFFTGALCDVRIYDTALKENTIKTLLHDGYGSAFEKLDNKATTQSVEPSLPKGLKIHYNGAASGTTLYDMSGNANHGTLVNGPTITASGKFNSGIVFDGTNDHATITASGIRDSLRNNFSIATWVKFDNLNSSEGIFGVYSSGSTTGANTNLMLYKRYNSSDSQNEINFTFYGSNFSARIDPTTDWIHIAATYGATPIDKNLIAHIPFDKSYSSRYPDKVTRRPHALNNGPVLVTNDATFDRCYSFDGTNDYVSIHGGVMREINKAVGEGNSGASCELTVMLWMKANNSPTSNHSKIYMLSPMIKFNWNHATSNYLGAYEIGTFTGGSYNYHYVKYSGLSGKYTDWNHYCLTIKKVTSESVGGNWTFVASTDIWTTSAAHNLNIGDIIEFTSNGGGANGYSTGTTYYVISVPTTTTLQLSASSGGSVVNGSSNSSGNWAAKTVPSLKVKIYLNGELDTSPTTSGSNSSGTVTFLNESMRSINNSGTMFYNSNSVYQAAKIKDFRVYNKTLSDDEISGIMLTKSIYLNGELLVSSSLNDSNSQMSYLNVSSANTATLGAVNDGSSLVRLDGTIDDFRVYDRKITSAEVSLLYNNIKDNFPLIQNTNGEPGKLYGSAYYLSNLNRPSNPLPKIKRDSLVIHYTFEGSSGLTILDKNFVDKPKEIYLNRRILGVSSSDSKNIVSTKVFNGTKNTVGGNWTFVASTDIWTTSAAHNLYNGDIIEFTTNGGGATGYSTGTTYYVISVPTTTTLQLSASNGGSVVDGSANSSGNWAAKTAPSDSQLLYKKCENFNGSSDYIETTFSSIGSNWTFTASSDTWTTSSAHGLKLGDKVILTTNGGGATGYNTSTIYYVISVPSTTTLKLSSTLLGSVVDGSANSSGNWAAKHLPIVLGDSLWSISCWINTNAVNKQQTIWSFSSTSATTNEYKLYITADGNKLSFMFNGDSSAEVDTGRTIYPNNWYNVVVVRKLIGLTESILVYINGEFVSTGNITLGNTTGDPTLKIGARFDKNGNFFGGKIADFRVYDSPLNSYQIQKLYQGEKTNGPIVHYTFDNSSSEIIKDMGSEGTHLTSNEAVLDNIKQKVGTSCLYFNGSTSYCKSSYPGLIGYTNNTGHPMTICFWFRKFKSTATGTLLNYGAANKEIKIQINSSSPYNIEAKVGSVTVESMFSTFDGIDETSEDASGDWNHLALVILPGKNYNNTIKNVRIFVNGVDQTKITSSDTLYETTMNTSDKNEIFLIGRARGEPKYFNGWIDDFRIYDTALSPSELFELHYNIYNYKTI